MLQLYLLHWTWYYLLQLKKVYFKCLMSPHCFYEQIDSSTPSSNLSVVSDIMKVGMLAVDIASQDEGSGVQLIDILYQKTSKGDGKFTLLLSFLLSLSSLSPPAFRATQGRVPTILCAHVPTCVPLWKALDESRIHQLKVENRVKQGAPTRFSL